MAARIRANSIFDLPKLVNDKTAREKSTPSPFRPRQSSLSVTVRRMENTKRRLPRFSRNAAYPAETAVSAIEVKRGRWLTSGFDALPSGRYHLKRASLRSVATVALEKRPEMFRLGHGAGVCR